MVRNKSGGKKIGKLDENAMKDVQNVVDGIRIRAVARTFKIKNSALRCYVEKCRKTMYDMVAYAPNFIVYRCSLLTKS